MDYSEPDTYTEVAARILGVGHADVTEEQRERTKRVVLELCYGRLSIRPEVQPTVMSSVTGRFRVKPHSRSVSDAMSVWGILL